MYGEYVFVAWFICVCCGLCPPPLQVQLANKKSGLYSATLSKSGVRLKHSYQRRFDRLAALLQQCEQCSEKTRRIRARGVLCDELVEDQVCTYVCLYVCMYSILMCAHIHLCNFTCSLLSHIYRTHTHTLSLSSLSYPIL